MSKNKKQGWFYRSFSGEYYGNGFEIIRRKMSKEDYESLKKKLGKRPRSKVEYVYTDSEVGSRYLTKKHYDNLINNSEILYDEKRAKSIRSPHDYKKSKRKRR